jgi:hypothetical protein
MGRNIRFLRADLERFRATFRQDAGGPSPLDDELVRATPFRPPSTAFVPPIQTRAGDLLPLKKVRSKLGNRRRPETRPRSTGQKECLP